jgi:hypothetical protein
MMANKPKPTPTTNRANAPRSHQGQIDCKTPFPMATTNGAVAADVTFIV